MEGVADWEDRTESLRVYNQFGMGESALTICVHENCSSLENDVPLPKIKQTTALRIQQARTKLGMTQDQLARTINETKSVVAGYETGKAIPTPSVITKLNKALKINIPKNQ